MEENKWKKLAEFFYHRLKRPLKHPEFILYFLLVIVGIGAIGIYTAILGEEIPSNKKDYVISNMASYFLAIIATGSVELIFIQEVNIKRSILLVSIAAIFINTFLFFLSIKFSSFWFATPGLIIAVLIWWIANAENTNIIESTFSSKIREEAREMHGKNW